MTLRYFPPGDYLPLKRSRKMNVQIDENAERPYAYVQEIAALEVEEIEEAEANAVFGGRLMAALPKVKDEPTYQEDHFFAVVQR